MLAELRQPCSYRALPDGEIEIERAAAMLDRAEAAARRRMDDITRQLYDCHAAAMYGYPVNCGTYLQQALWRAQQRLTHILHVRRQFKSAG